MSLGKFVEDLSKKSVRYSILSRDKKEKFLVTIKTQLPKYIFKITVTNGCHVWSTSMTENEKEWWWDDQSDYEEIGINLEKWEKQLVDILKSGKFELEKVKAMYDWSFPEREYVDLTYQDEVAYHTIHLYPYSSAKSADHIRKHLFYLTNENNRLKQKLKRCNALAKRKAMTNPYTLMLKDK